MADLTYFQKYPKADEDQSGAKSYRIDHPDFADVLRTVYAKGFITDFENIELGPEQIKSRVKVKIGDEEYPDFIPVFFCPKAQYWDDELPRPPGISATDFNEEDKYFERAWMSFQATDEVVVLLQSKVDEPDLKPVAVLGFVDGVPRIGELILQIHCAATHGYYHQTDTPLPPVERMRHFKILSTELDGSYITYYYGDEDEEVTGPDDLPLKLLKEITYINSGYKSFFFEIVPGYPGFQTKKYDWYYYKFLITVGPFLIIFQVRYYIFEDYFNYIFQSNYSNIQEFSIQTILNTPENIAIASEMQYTMAQRVVHVGWDPINTDIPIWGSPVWDVYDNAHNLEIASVTKGVYPWANYYGTGNENFQYRPDWESVVFKVRPHSKADLLAADMWPKEEEGG